MTTKSVKKHATCYSCMLVRASFTPDLTDSVWLGGREANPSLEEDIWMWDMSGMPVNDTLWNDGQPDNHNGAQDHICMYKVENGLNDGTQSTPRMFLCETEYLLC